MTTTAELPRNRRWWIPATLIALATGTVLCLRAIEQPFIEPITLGIGLLTGLLIVFWYIFLTGLNWKIRLMLTAVVVGLIGAAYYGIKNLTRIEGSIGGSGIPRLVWKWSPKRDSSMAHLVVEPETASAQELSATNAAPAANFPQFLGPNRLGTLTGVSLARDWQRTPQPLWRQPIGLGWSAFAVAGHRAVTQEQRQEQELVVCYDLLTGRPLWAHTNLARFSEPLGGDGPRATPTLQKDRVYALGATGILDCLALETGRPIWSRDSLRENGLANIMWGKSCSPLLVNGLVIVSGGEQNEKSLLAYQAATGEPVWQGGRDRASYCSPTLAMLEGQEQIVIVNGHSVTGHDLKDGTVLWEYAWPGEFPKVAQPLAVDTHRLLIAAGYGLGCAMLKLDRSPAGAWTVSELWKNRNLKPKFANLVRRGDHVYALDDGILACLGLEKGERVWKEGRYGHGQILLVDDLLLIQAESGEVALVEANPQKPREIARFSALKGKTWNNPVLVGDLLLVRNDREAACYRLPLSTEKR